MVPAGKERGVVHAAMRVVFRVDASVQMGTGHVMRCLTLADALRGQGAECHFICRAHAGNLIPHIQGKGYTVHVLPESAGNQGAAADFSNAASGAPPLAHARWLGATQQQDAAECEPLLRRLRPGWLVVDHYALDASWESALRPYCDRLMVIDDLADRRHLCDLLLDQTFGRNQDDYLPWIPSDSALLCGAQYALLRPEFAVLRLSSLKHRASPELKRLLIAMGGIDQTNATGQVLEALKRTSLPTSCSIAVVMGANAPWLAEVRRLAGGLPWTVDICVNVDNMAQLMADSDLAIGAAGSTAWERCCLGLPTAMVVLADNQQQVAKGLERAGAAWVLYDGRRIVDELPNVLAVAIASPMARAAASRAAARIVDGRGVEAVVRHLLGGRE